MKRQSESCLSSQTGKADCPYYAKVELLADQLSNSVNSFHVHKIVKTPDEWESWLQQECAKRKFNCKKCPLVWRELVDRGGKGILIGGANEFQEYALGYYGVTSELTTSDVTKIAGENLSTKVKVDEEMARFKNQSRPMKICITSAGSPVCYHVLNAIASGSVFGENQELTINLLGNDEELEVLGGVQMEVMDLAWNSLRGITVQTNADAALKDCEAVIVLDQLVRKVDEDEASWLKRNSDMLVSRIKVIDKVCKANVKVLLAGNGPINSSLYVAHQESELNIDRQNIIAMPRLIENQAKAVLARKVKVKTSDIVDVIVWGDNEKYFCDINQARVHNHDGPIWGPPSYSRLANILVHEEQWLIKDFPEMLLVRYTQETEKMCHVPAFAHAAAINSLIKQWWFGSPEDQMVTLGVASEGWYGVPEGMVFNFPAKILPSGQYTVVTDLEISEDTKSKIAECVDYLLEQKYQLYPDQRPPPPPEPEKPEEISESPHPPTMTPIKEETDVELRPTADDSSAETTTQSDTEVGRTTSAEPALAKIQEDIEPTEEQAEDAPPAPTDLAAPADASNQDIGDGEAENAPAAE